MERTDHLDRINLVSGGQTGIDRAMLDFCIEHRIHCGGWCPQDRKAEDGTIILHYPVKELPRASYDRRTAANVEDSDATVIIYFDEMKGGTLKSFEFARKEEKALLLLDMSVWNVDQACRRLLGFIRKCKPGIINFSGPRLSEWNEGYDLCYAILESLFAYQKETPSADANGVGISNLSN